MVPPDVQPPPLPPEAQIVSEQTVRQPFRFSVKAMLLTIAAFAAVCCAAVVLPREIAHLIIGAAGLAASGCLLIGVIFARGEKQAFCIGAALVLASMWTSLGGQFMQGVHGTLNLLGKDALTDSRWIWIDFGVLAVAALANGYLCVRARRYFERP